MRKFGLLDESLEFFIKIMKLVPNNHKAIKNIGIKYVIIS